MYIWDGVDVPRDQLSVLARSDDFVFRPIWISTSMDVILVLKETIKSSNFHNIYKAMRQLVSSNRDDNVVRNDNLNYLHRSFLGYLLLRGKECFDIEQILAFPLPIHIMFLNKKSNKQGMANQQHLHHYLVSFCSNITILYFSESILIYLHKSTRT